MKLCSVFGTTESSSNSSSLQQKTTTPVQAMTDSEKGENYEINCMCY